MYHYSFQCVYIWILCWKERMNHQNEWTIDNMHSSYTMELFIPDSFNPDNFIALDIKAELAYFKYLVLYLCHSFRYIQLHNTPREWATAPQECRRLFVKNYKKKTEQPLNILHARWKLVISPILFTDRWRSTVCSTRLTVHIRVCLYINHWLKLGENRYNLNEHLSNDWFSLPPSMAYEILVLK